MHKYDDETRPIEYQNTFQKVKKEVYERYGSEIDMDKIYANLSRETFSSLNFVFCPGEGVSEFGISYNQVKMLTLCHIGTFIDDKKELLHLQGSASNPASYEHYRRTRYRREYDISYIEFLENLHDLHNAFDYIKEYYPQNYSCWTDEWRFLFKSDIVEFRRKNMNTTNVNNIEMIEYVFGIIPFLEDISYNFIEERGKKKAEREAFILEIGNRLDMARKAGVTIDDKLKKKVISDVRKNPIWHSQKPLDLNLVMSCYEYLKRHKNRQEGVEA